jgi:hypothetical protein
MLSTLTPIVTLASEPQRENVLLSMLVTPLPIVTLASELQ